MSVGLAVSGLLLSTASTRQSLKFFKAKDVSADDSADMVLHDLNISLPQPPKCGAAGGLNNRLISRVAQALSSSSALSCKNEVCSANNGRARDAHLWAYRE